VWLETCTTAPAPQQLCTALQAWGVLENVARVVLKCICRASHVRLPTATLSSLLDETPLGQGEVSSSMIQVDPAIMQLPPSFLPASVLIFLARSGGITLHLTLCAVCQKTVQTPHMTTCR